MSEHDVEIIRGVFEHWERGDFDTPEAFDAEVELARLGGVHQAGKARDADRLCAAPRGERLPA